MSPLRIITGVILYLFTLTLMAQEFGERVTLTKSYHEDLYTAAGTIVSSSIIDGDLAAAGGTLIIDGNITGDAVLSCGDCNITAEINDDLRAMGGTLLINSKVGGDAILAGGQIVLSQNSEVAGRAWMAGGQVTIAARINRELRVAGGNVVLSGIVSGDVYIWSESITIDEDAVIEGDLTYHSPNEASIHPNARINGTVIYTKTEYPRHGSMHSLFTLITLTITAIVFYLLFPALSDRSSRTIGDEFWKVLGVGVVTLLVVPFVAIFMMSIVIGVWIGLILMALYLVGLLLGSLIGMLFIGKKLAQLAGQDPALRSRRIVSLLAAYVIIGLVQLIPVVGGLTTLLIMLTGMGGGMLSLYRLYLSNKQSEQNSSQI